MKTRWYCLAVFLAGGSLGHAAEARGVITKLDAAKKELVVDVRGVLAGPGMLLSLELPADATVQIGLIAPQSGTVKSLAVGQRVRVTYQERGGRRTVQLVRIVALLSPPSEPTPATPVASGKADVAAGTLRYIGYAERDLVLAHAGAGGREAYTPVQVPDSARITRDGQPIRFEDLKQDEAVSVQFAMKDGKRLALSVQAGTITDQPMAQPPPAQAGVPQRGERLKKALQQLGQFVEQAGQGKGPIVIDPQKAMQIRKLLAAGEQGLEQLREQGNGGDRLANLRQIVQMGAKVTAEIAQGNAPKELNIEIDPALAASLNKVLVITDQVLYFVEQERSAAAANR
jgi:hypothetical protein